MGSADGTSGSWAFLRFEHAFRDGLHTYTARADSTLVNEVWRGLQDLAPYPDDPELNPMDLYCIGNFAGERLAVWRAVAWAVTEGLHRCGIPHWDRDNAAVGLGVDRDAMRLVRWEYDLDVADGDLGFVPARASVRIHPPPDQWEIDHGGFAGLFPLASFDDLTRLDGAVFASDRAQVTVFGLDGDRFDALADALNAPDRPVLADILRPGEMVVSLATVRDDWMTHWTNTLTVRATSETDVVYRAAAHFGAAYQCYLDGLDSMKTLADFRSAAALLLA
ncbi:hypothetical protein GCM10009827_072290 [Dactylosporangium maewongense]|uniref:Uncharacterized protein n=1 Tax=Dactylosporangium maewongense TaxID=634393 RepID=A0ABN2BM53_9ACTN